MSSDEVSQPQLEPKHDRRFFEMGEYESPASIDVREQQINQLIEAAHCRLLEAATGGRLTWNGDRIVARVPSPANADAHQDPDFAATTASEKPCNP